MVVFTAATVLALRNLLDKSVSCRMRQSTWVACEGGPRSSVERDAGRRPLLSANDLRFVEASGRPMQSKNRIVIQPTQLWPRWH